jgi:hypothetical protein
VIDSKDGPVCGACGKTPVTDFDLLADPMLMRPDEILTRVWQVYAAMKRHVEGTYLSVRTSEYDAGIEDWMRKFQDALETSGNRGRWLDRHRRGAFGSKKRWLNPRCGSDW